MGKNASIISEDGLRDVWYRYCEFVGEEPDYRTMMMNDNLNWPTECQNDMKLYMKKRRERFTARKLDQYFKSLPAGQYDKKKKSEIQ